MFPKVSRWIPTVSLAWALQIICTAPSQAQEPKPIFDLDCVSFSGRFMANAPVKKKVYPGLAVDGTAWSLAPDAKRPTITRVFAGEAAEKAGIQAGDEIVSINGYSTDDMKLRELFAAYHMFEPDTMTETLVVQQKGGTQKSVKLQLLTVDKCNPEEKAVWLGLYKGWGY